MELVCSITTSYYRGAHGVLIVYDVSDKNSFENIKNKWIINVRKYCNLNTSVIIAGNKCDLVNLETYENDEVKSYMESNNIQHIFTSTKDDINISEIFNDIIESMMECNLSHNNKDTVKLSSGKSPDFLTRQQCCL
jgi:Ras-related protein Rab-1A